MPGTRSSTGAVARAQRSWRGVAVALVLLVATVAAGYRWGVPLAAQGLVAALPSSADQSVGDAALAQLDGEWFQPSKLPQAEQEQWRQRFGRMLEQAHAGPRDPQPAVPWQLHFRQGGERLGANALALPGGHIVMTDEMLALLEGAPDTVLGVLAHEYGHVRRRHGMNAVARLALVSLALSAAFGDASSVVLAVPVLLAQADYSREAEREADADAARILRDSGRSPAVMVALFERMAAGRNMKASESNQESAASAPSRRKLRPQLPIAFASHPQDEERIRFFREAAVR
jgi:Zn-dependent protease with chaperone function